MNQPSLPVSAIHKRTAKGQLAILQANPDLSPMQTRLLLMVNGFTPTEWLLALLSSHQSVPDGVVCDLERGGLIARIE